MVYDQREALMETQAERFGSGGFNPARKLMATVDVEVKYTFSEAQIKEILANYVTEHFGKPVTAKDVSGSYRAPSYGNQFDNDPGHCEFTVKARG